MAALSVEQERDILRAFLKEILKNKGLKNFRHTDIRRELADFSKTENFFPEDVYAVFQPIYEELFFETLPKRFHNDGGVAIGKPGKPEPSDQTRLPLVK